jgi:hypothetical protein
MFEGEIKKPVYDRGKYTRDDIEGDWGSLLPVCEKWHKVGNLRIYDKKDPIREKKSMIRTEYKFARKVRRAGRG